MDSVVDVATQTIIGILIGTMKKLQSYFIVSLALSLGMGLLLSTPPAMALANDNGLMPLINTAGRQRMLSQRIAKAYCQIGLNARSDEAREQLKTAVAEFDAQHANLRRTAPTSPVADALTIVDAIWKPYRETATAPYSPEGALRVMQLSEDVLAAAQSVVERLEVMSAGTAGRIVNLAGRQRMLSQRLAKYYLLRELGVHPPLVTDGIETVRKEFMAAQATLRAAPETNQDARKLIEYIDTQWQLLDYSLQQRQGMMAEFVVLSADKILNAAEVLTGIYETLGRPTPAAKK